MEINFYLNQAFMRRNVKGKLKKDECTALQRYQEECQNHLESCQNIPQIYQKFSSSDNNCPFYTGLEDDLVTEGKIYKEKIEQKIGKLRIDKLTNPHIYLTKAP